MFAWVTGSEKKKSLYELRKIHGVCRPYKLQQERKEMCIYDRGLLRFPHALYYLHASGDVSGNVIGSTFAEKLLVH